MKPSRSGLVCPTCSRPMGGLAPTSTVPGRPDLLVHLRCVDQTVRRIRALKNLPAWIVQGARAYWAWFPTKHGAAQYFGCTIRGVTDMGNVVIELDDGYERRVTPEVLCNALPATVEVRPGHPPQRQHKAQGWRDV